jgi:dynein heavy chain
MHDDADYMESIPCGYSSMKLFDKLLILKIFKPEKLMFAFQKYVHEQLGQLYAESPVATMDALFESSDNRTPIIFVLSQGADPT